MTPQLIFLGAPGSGKGTQAARFSQELGFKHISTGNLLREEISEGSTLGKRVQGILSAGNLVDDQTVLELLCKNCNLNSHQYIFDGFPRNIKQAELLDDVLIKDHLSKTIFFKIELKELTERLVNRRTCDNCGAIYNLFFRPPQKSNTCDHCGHSPLTQRKDDTREVVENRLNVFCKTIKPVLNYYKAEQKLETVDASKKLDSVHSEIQEIIERKD